MMRVLIIGAGQVGFNLGRYLKTAAVDVTFMDTDASRVNYCREQGYKAINWIESALLKNNSEDSIMDLAFICVPTPTINGYQKLKVVYDACNWVSENWKHFADNETEVVLKSTVLPGSTLKITNMFFDKKRVLCNPEFLTEKNALADIVTERAVIGGVTVESAQQSKLAKLYKEYYIGDVDVERQLIFCTFEEAEVIKYVSNCYLAAKVAWWCEVDELCKRLNITTAKIIEGVTSDERLGVYGSTIVGKGFSGSCLPKDTLALQTFLADRRFSLKLLDAAIAINRLVTPKTYEEID